MICFVMARAALLVSSCDIEQTPNVGSSLGVTAPSLNTHAEIWSYKPARFAVKNEYAATQGVDAYRKISGRRPLSPLLRCWPKIDEPDARLLAGNGLHVAVLAAWFAYVTGNARRLAERITNEHALAPQRRGRR